MGVLAQPLPLGDDPSPTAFLFFISDKLIAAEKVNILRRTFSTAKQSKLTY